MSENISQTKAVQLLLDAARDRKPIEPLTPRVTDGEIEAAYAVQNMITQHGIDSGRRLIGRKIGLTAPSVQAQMGIDQPDFGVLFADMAVANGDTIPTSSLIQPKVEGEVAFVLKDDLLSPEPTIADVLDAVDYAVAAIEVVDSRIADWKIGIFDTVADNASSGLFVLGCDPRRIDALDLRHCGMVMDVNGVPASVGAGAACLGHPLNAALWLARKMVEVDRPLEAGDIILSGALGPMVAVAPGDHVQLKISGLGSAAVHFGQKERIST